MKFGSILSTQPYLNPYLGMSRTFDTDLRTEVVLVIIRRKYPKEYPEEYPGEYPGE